MRRATTQAAGARNDALLLDLAAASPGLVTDPDIVARLSHDQAAWAPSSAGATWADRSYDPAQAEAPFAARRLAYPALERLGPVLTEDVCVPINQVPAMLARIDAIAGRHGEHAVGLTKRPGLDRELSPVAMDMHRAVKRALDSAGIITPQRCSTRSSSEPPTPLPNVQLLNPVFWPEWQVGCNAEASRSSTFERCHPAGLVFRAPVQ